MTCEPVAADDDTKDTTLDSTPILTKANFDDVYDQSDPRGYYCRLGAYDYSVPHYARQVFRQVIDALAVPQPTVVDLCCSYGINAALLKHDVELHELYDRYRSDDVAGLSADDLVERDRQFYAEVRRDTAPEVIGLDIAGNAVDYAVEVGLLDHGIVADLEASDPSPEVAKTIGTADLLTVTGGIGYVTERTFERILGCADPDDKPWVAALCLRTVPFEPIADCLAEQGLVTEQLDGVTFPQRRFASEDERAYALNALDALGVEPDGREAEGAYHVNVFLARPECAAAAVPIDQILDDLADIDDHVASA